MKYCPNCRRDYSSTQRFCHDDGSRLMLEDPYRLVGRVLDGKYGLEALVGIGGMGAVYIAHHYALNRRVALKILQPNLALASERVIEAFDREAKTAARLTHENIAVTLDAGRTVDNIAYIAMEWLEGLTLEDEIARSGRFSFSRTSGILRQIAAALEVAHQARIIHRDLKPLNIMLIERPSGRDQVKVLDFGIAKVMDETAGSPITSIAGTPHYASPEQLRVGSNIDVRADIYSLGVTLYQMLTGALPFHATTVHELILLQMTGSPPPLRKWRSDAPAAVEDLISRMLSKNPDQRPSRAQDIPDLFDRAWQGHINGISTNDQSTLLDRHGWKTAVTSAETKEATGHHFKPESFDTILETDHTPAPAQVEVEASSDEILPRRRLRAVIALLVLAVIIISLVLSGLIWSGKEIDSIAVLPLKSAGADSNAEYLSAGLTEGLITSLSRLPKLRVIARSSVFRYKDGAPDPKTAGSELNVQAVIVGEVAQRGDKLSVGLELVDTRDNHRLWAGQYERKLADLLTLQEEITREAAAALRRELGGADQQRLLKFNTANPEAHQLYLKGRYYWNTRTVEGLQQGIDYFQKALGKDPQNALAYSGLADSYFVLGPVGIDALPARETMPKQKAAALKALELDDTLAEAHTSLAVVKLVYDWDWAGAEREYRRALELNPNYAIAHNWYSIFLASRGKTDEAIAESRLAETLDPFSANFGNNLAAHYYYARQFDQAANQYRKTIATFPKFPESHAGLARTYQQQGKFGEALSELDRAIALSRRSPRLIAALAYTYATAGRKEEASALLRELKRSGQNVDVSPGDYALLFLGQNDRDQVFTWLRKAYDERSVSLIFLKVDPAFDRIRSDLRFVQLLALIG